MRNDLDHKFNERRGTKYTDKYPRSNKKIKFRAKQSVAVKDMDSGPKRESMGLAHRAAHQWKNFDRHNWTIVRRTLQHNVGRPWDDVFSEICEATDSRTHEGHELRDWVETHYVEIHCQMINGDVYNDRGVSIVNHRTWQDEFFVHPETKLLCKSPFVPWKKKKPEETRPCVLELKDTLYHQHDGIWYRVKFKHWKYERIYHCGTCTSHIGHRMSRFCQDVFVGKDYQGGTDVWNATQDAERKYGKSTNGEYRFCIWKQAANGKEITKLKKKYQWD